MEVRRGEWAELRQAIGLARVPDHSAPLPRRGQAVATGAFDRRLLEAAWPKLTAVFHTLSYLIAGVVVCRGRHSARSRSPGTHRQLCDPEMRALKIGAITQ